MVRRLHEVKGTGKIINCFDLFGSLTGDVIGQYAFAQSYGFLEDPNFSPHWHDILMDVSKGSHMLKQFGFMLPMMKAMPEWMVKLTTPNMIPLMKFQKVATLHRVLMAISADILRASATKSSTRRRILMKVCPVSSTFP